MATSANPGGSVEKSNSTESMDVSDPPGPKVNLCRRESGILQITQPLYQEYSHQALDREIQRQRRDERSASPSPEGRRGGGRRATGVRASLVAPLGLWRDVPEVRASRWFPELSAELQRLQEVKFELISSEASYLRSLDIAVDHFQSSETLMSLLSTQERQWLFSKLPAVRDVSRRFLSELEENFEENMLDFDVCRILLSHLPDFRSVYIPYVTNQSYQEKIFKNLIHKDPNFLRAVEVLESHELCQRLTLKSFLILPFQRITRLRLLVQNILQRSTRGSQDEETARMAAEALGELMRECNEKVQRMKSTEQLIALSRMIDFESKVFPLISESRRLVKQGELTEVGVAGGNISWRRGTSRSLYLHLFNDYLLLSRHKENGRFSVFDHTFSRNVVVENVKVRSPCVHRFLLRLTLVTNQHGKLREHHLKAHTQSEKLRWISALTPIKEEIDLTQYYGSRQVQCLKRYRAHQYDELQLEKADILIVTQECEDGWEEGFRLSDGDRGWFPSTHVQTIVSQRARARNIEDRLRLNRPS